MRRVVLTLKPNLLFVCNQENTLQRIDNLMYCQCAPHWSLFCNTVVILGYESRLKFFMPHTRVHTCAQNAVSKQVQP